MAFRETFEKRVERDGKKPFVFFRDQVIDYVTLQGKVHRAANLLRELGVRKGDPVCLFLPNCLEFLYLWFGLAEIGGVMVPLDVNLRGDGLKYIINHCDARWIIVNERLLDTYSIVENGLSRIDHRVWHGEADPPGENFLSLSRLMEAAEEKAPPPLAIREEDPLGILYTSGATGPPKGVMISHFNYLNSGEIWAKDVIHYRPDDIFFTTLPLFHANAQMFTAMGSLFSGRPFVLRERFSASRFFDEIRQYGASSVQVMRRLCSALVGLADSVTEAERKAVVQRYLHHLSLVVEHSVLDAEDQVMALQEDRQGLGQSRRRVG